MKRRSMKRYLILLTVLIVCAGAAWYFTNESGNPQGNVVLAAENVWREAGRR